MGFLPKCCFDGSASPSTCTKQPSTTIEHLCHRFSLPQLRKSTSNFSQIISRYGFGLILYKGCIFIDGQPKEIAVKQIDPRFSFIEGQALSEFRNEILMMGQLHHPNLVSLVGFCDDKNEMKVVYEYVPNQSLGYHLHERDSKSPKLSWKKRLEICIGAARGLHYLHSGTKRTIIHRDVRPWNILLDENWIPKLTGFGLSIRGPKSLAKAAKPIELGFSIIGATGYTAPELLHDKIVTYKCDVYSFGLILIELICAKRPWDIKRIGYQESKNKGEGEPAFPCSNMNIVARKARDLVEKGNGENIIDPNLVVGEIAAECWKLYMDIAESCLSEDPDERPDMGEVEVELERVLELQEKADANHTY